MGGLIVLAERLADGSRPSASSRPAFFFDVGCPFSYLAAERVERILGEVEWVPTSDPLPVVMNANRIRGEDRCECVRRLIGCVKQA